MVLGIAFSYSPIEYDFIKIFLQNRKQAFTVFILRGTYDDALLNRYPDIKNTIGGFLALKINVRIRKHL
jgi:hypothetical protein